MPLTPEDPLPDLEQRLLALHAMGAMEYEAGEAETIGFVLGEMDRVSQEAMHRLPQ